MIYEMLQNMSKISLIQHVNLVFKYYSLNGKKFIISNLTTGMLTTNILRLYGPRRKKTCLGWFVNNKGADQPFLFTYWKVIYLNLLQVRFQFSS